MEMLSGAEMVIRSLQDQKIEYIYGYPGGSVLHIYDALAQQDQVKHILVRHEHLPHTWLTLMRVHLASLGLC